ncbi:MAG: hypothetical protein ACREUE_10055, partial [Panacagrimonas sp.]
LAAVFWLAAGPPAQALDYQVHGFAAQAYLVSEGNNFFGDSTNGSHDFYEAALNGSVVLGSGLLASAQVMIRDAGLTDTGKPRLDYALLDWNVLQGVDSSAGIRIGRVKNAMGLFNDTRDVIFARPGILLPQSVYYDGAGLRGIFFSSDGAQLYGSTTLGRHEISVSLNGALERDFTDKERQVLLGGSGFGSVRNDIHVRDLVFAQVLDSYNGGRLTFGLSHARARVVIDPSSSLPIDAALKVRLYVASLRYNAERFSITGEYMYTRSETHTNFTGDSAGASDGGYVQLDVRLTPQWTAYTRYDATFSDADDRDGSEAAQQTGEDRYSRFAHDVMIGASWKPDAHWGIWAEVHRIYGTATAPALDNPDGADDERWTLFTVMAAYRF